MFHAFDARCVNWFMSDLCLTSSGSLVTEAGDSVEVCRTWKRRDSRHWRGLCANTFYPTGGFNGCYICDKPMALEPPKGCFGCPPTEVFPVHWKFKEDFDVPFLGSQVVTTTDAATYPILNAVPPGSSSPATATITRVMPDAVRSEPLTAVIQNNDGTIQHGCLWGAGAWKYSGWLWKPTFGNPGTPKPGVCGLTTGFNEKRIEYAGGGPFIYSTGLSIVANNYPATNACYAPPGSYRFANMPETAWPASGLGYPYFGGEAARPPGSAPLTCFGSNVPYYAYLRQTCVGWGLVGFGSGSDIYLYVSVSGYRYIDVSPVLFCTANPFYGVYCHGYIGANTNYAPSTSCQSLNPLFAVIPTPTTGTIIWQGTYPCGNPSSFNLTRVSRTGCLAGSIVPTTVTLVRGDS